MSDFKAGDLVHVEYDGYYDGDSLSFGGVGYVVGQPGAQRRYAVPLTALTKITEPLKVGDLVTVDSEPPPGAIVIQQGGEAYRRNFATKRWYAATDSSAPVDWHDIAAYDVVTVAFLPS